MDEPFSALDAQTRLQMQQMLLDLWQEFRMTVIFITHDIDEAIFLSDRLIILTERPGGIKAEIGTGLKRPRLPELLTSSEFMFLKRQCMELLRGLGRQTGRSAQNPSKAVNYRLLPKSWRFRTKLRQG